MTQPPADRTLSEGVERLNNLYREQLKDTEIVLREIPGEPRYRLILEPIEPAKHQQHFQKDFSESLNEEQMQAYIAGLEAAPQIERLSESESAESL
jgi:hypothetical protein